MEIDDRPRLSVGGQVDIQPGDLELVVGLGIDRGEVDPAPIERVPRQPAVIGKRKHFAEGRTALVAIGYAAGPILLVVIQPDIGTALVYGAALGAVLFVAGTRWIHLAALAAGAVIAILAVLWLLPAAGVHLLKPYQQQRLTQWTHPSSDPQGATYNLFQSEDAVGAGGVRGRGVAGALKRAQIRWALANGLERLETTNELRNEPMQRVNLGLGYRPTPGRITLEGPLSAGP